MCTSSLQSGCDQGGCDQGACTRSMCARRIPFRPLSVQPPLAHHVERVRRWETAEIAWSRFAMGCRVGRSRGATLPWETVAMCATELLRCRASTLCPHFLPRTPSAPPSYALHSSLQLTPNLGCRAATCTLASSLVPCPLLPRTPSIPHSYALQPSPVPAHSTPQLRPSPVPTSPTSPQSCCLRGGGLSQRARRPRGSDASPCDGDL